MPRGTFQSGSHRPCDLAVAKWIADFSFDARDERRSLMRQCVLCHRENRELYVCVMYPDYKPLDCDSTGKESGSNPGDYGGFTLVGDKLYFTATDSTYGSELRALDTTDNSYELIDINPGISDSQAGRSSGFVAVGDQLYFKALDVTYGQELRVLSIAANAPGVFGGDLTATTPEDNATVGVATFTDTTDGSSNPNFMVSSVASNGMATIDALGNWS